MTQTIPPLGSVEHFVEMILPFSDRLSNVYTYAFQHVASVMADPHGSDHARLNYVSNIVAAVALVRDVPAPAVSAEGADGPQEPAEDATITPLPGSHVVHLGTTHDAKTSCGLLLADLDDSFRWTFDHGDVTCTACIDGVPF